MHERIKITIKQLKDEIKVLSTAGKIVSIIEKEIERNLGYDEIWVNRYSKIIDIKNVDDLEYKKIKKILQINRTQKEQDTFEEAIAEFGEICADKFGGYAIRFIWNIDKTSCKLVPIEVEIPADGVIVKDDGSLVKVVTEYKIECDEPMSEIRKKFRKKGKE